MKQFLWTLFLNIIGCFNGPGIICHAIAVLLTLALVTAGLDWRQLGRSRNCDTVGLAEGHSLNLFPQAQAEFEWHSGSTAFQPVLHFISSTSLARLDSAHRPAGLFTDD